MKNSSIYSFQIVYHKQICFVMRTRSIISRIYNKLYIWEQMVKNLWQNKQQFSQILKRRDSIRALFLIFLIWLEQLRNTKYIMTSDKKLSILILTKTQGNSLVDLIIYTNIYNWKTLRKFNFLKPSKKTRNFVYTDKLKVPRQYNDSYKQLAIPLCITSRTLLQLIVSKLSYYH